MLAVVLLARRCLWVQLGNHGFDLAKVSGKLWRTPAGVLIDAVHACTPVLQKGNADDYLTLDRVIKWL